MQGRLLDGFSLVELCFAIVIFGISIAAFAPISRVSLVAKSSQKSLQDLDNQKRIFAARLKEPGGVSGLSEFCAQYEIECFLDESQTLYIDDKMLNLTLPAAPKSAVWLKL